MSSVRTGQNGELSCERFNALRCGISFEESADRVEEPGAMKSQRPIPAPGFNGEAGYRQVAAIERQGPAVQNSVSCTG
jgi:hypothetical protein